MTINTAVYIYIYMCDFSYLLCIILHGSLIHGTKYKYTVKEVSRSYEMSDPDIGSDRIRRRDHNINESR